MFRLSTLFSCFLSVMVLFFIFYGTILLLPLLLIVLLGCFVYMFIKFRLIQYLCKKKYSFETKSEYQQGNKVIDAEFEILNEKSYK